ncbi:MAG: SPOR domain-containing protein [Helicobacteraceae bacterium]|jgi:cell division septation protein DedD|nr:SPOR domain-containing protein [Helicobacteraceae bacterium]
MAEILGSNGELNDILIKHDEGFGSKFKSALLLTAAVILIFVIGYLTMRVIDTSNQITREITPDGSRPTADGDQAGAANAAGGENGGMFVPPQPVTTDPQQVKSTIDEIIARHREARERDKNQVASYTGPAPTATDAKPKTDTISAIPELPTQVSNQPKADPAKQAVTTPKKDPVKVAETPKKEPAKAAETAETPKAATTAPKASEKQVSRQAIGGKFYIQIQSFANEPKDDYLRSLANKGSNITVSEHVLDGRVLHRVYVGPYSTRDEALKALPNVRRNYNEQAFIAQEPL